MFIFILSVLSGNVSIGDTAVGGADVAVLLGTVGVAVGGTGVAVLAGAATASVGVGGTVVNGGGVGVGAVAQAAMKTAAAISTII
jgi:hypothetical protein